MKLLLLPMILLFALSTNFLSAQKKAIEATTTVILLRHAEKDTGDNPSLSASGKQRAERLAALFPGTVPDAFYSTPFIRTQSTLEPWAKQVNKPVLNYDTKNLPEFADSLKDETGKTIVVVGHTNTIPALVNLLIGEEKYDALTDGEYSKIFIVTIKKGKAKEKIITY